MSKLSALKSAASKAKGFNPSQPRASDGKWTKGASKAMQTLKDLSNKVKAPPKAMTAAQYQAAGAKLMPSGLKQKMDKMREESGSAVLIQNRQAAKDEATALFNQTLQMKQLGHRVPREMVSAISESRAIAKKIDEKVAAQIQELAPQMAQFRKSLLDKSTVSKRQATEFANSIEVDPKAGNAADIRKAAYDYALMTNGGGLSTLKKFTKDTDRAYAKPWENSVNVGSNPSKGILFHEMAHHLEFADRRIGESAIDWVKGKATGGLQKLKDITGNPNYTDQEEAYPDKFISPYVGKMYKDKSGNITAVTEVISMGVERMATPESMAEFYLQDPEHFMFVLGVMKGRAR